MILYSDLKHSYAEVRPYDGEWGWTALPRYATPLSDAEARDLQDVLGGRILPDPRESFFTPRANHPIAALQTPRQEPHR